MQLTCKINQTEAIIRGFNADSTVKLEIDITTLTPEERSTLAANFDSGEFKRGHSHRLIPEPTVQGFLETLRQLAANDAEEKARNEPNRLAKITRAGENFSKRTTRNFSSEISANLIDGEVKLCERYAGEDATRANLSYTCIEPRKDYESDDKEWSRLMATPEGITWHAELVAINAAAKADAETTVIAKFHRMAQRRAEKAASLETFRQWALTHGSETLRLRIEEGFDWQSLASQEWTAAMLQQAGITDTPLTDPEGYTADVDDLDEPTAEQIKTLRRFRESLATIPDMKSSLELKIVTYTEDQDADNYPPAEPDVIIRHQIRVDITTPHTTETRWFQA